MKMRLIRGMTDDPKILGEVERLLKEVKDFTPLGLPAGGEFRTVRPSGEVIPVAPKGKYIEFTGKTGITPKKKVNSMNTLQQEAKKYKSADEFIDLAKSSRELAEFEHKLWDKTYQKAFGFKNQDIITIPTNKIKIVEKVDLAEAKRVKRLPITKNTPPVEVKHNIKTGEFTLIDGHHRYLDAKKQGVPFKVAIAFFLNISLDMVKIFEEQFGISTKEFFKTKSQLKEIWNKANR